MYECMHGMGNQCYLAWFGHFPKLPTLCYLATLFKVQSSIHVFRVSLDAPSRTQTE